MGKKREWRREKEKEVEERESKGSGGEGKKRKWRREEEKEVEEEREVEKRGKDKKEERRERNRGVKKEIKRKEQIDILKKKNAPMIGTIEIGTSLVGKFDRPTNKQTDIRIYTEVTLSEER